MNGETKPTRKYYDMFIGDFTAQLDIKTIRFVIMVEKPVKSFKVFVGPVVARQKEATHLLGQEYEWVNPMREMEAGKYPLFIPVNENYVLDNFEEILPDVIKEMCFWRVDG